METLGCRHTLVNVVYADNNGTLIKVTPERIHKIAGNVIPELSFHVINSRVGILRESFIGTMTSLRLAVPFGRFPHFDAIFPV